MPAPSGPQQLTFGEGKDYQPVFNPDGRQIVFFSSMDGPWDLYDLTVRGVRRLPLPSGQDYHHPHFMSDGRSLLFTANGGGEWQIYRCAMPGCTSPVQLTSGPGKKRFPVASPDGRQITYMCDTTGNEDICVMDEDGGSPRVLVSSPAYDGMQTYSPDGSKLAFQSGRDGNQELYVLDLGSGAISRLTNDGERDASPAWSPDGEWIAFETHRDGNTEIYAMRGGWDGGAQPHAAPGRRLAAFLLPGRPRDCLPVQPGRRPHEPVAAAVSALTQGGPGGGIPPPGPRLHVSGASRMVKWRSTGACSTIR